MASPIKSAVRDILQQLQSITDSFNTPVFQLLTVYNNQFDRMAGGDGYAFPMPAAFVEAEQPGYQALGMGVSAADMTFRIHIAHDQLDAGDGTLDQNFDVLDIRDLVKDALTMFKPRYCSHLYSSSETEDYNHAGVYHMVLSFTCSFTDTKGSPLDPESHRYITKQPPTDLEVDYTPSL